MKTAENDLVFIYLTIDLFILNLAIFITSWTGNMLFGLTPDNLNIHLLHANFSWIVTYFILTKRNLYLRDKFINRIWRITKRTFIFLVVLSVVAFLTTPNHFSRSFLLIYAAIFYLGKIIFYKALYTYLKYKRKRGLNTNRVLIVGFNETTRLLRLVIESNPMLGYQFIGFASSKFGQNDQIIGQTKTTHNYHKTMSIFNSYKYNLTINNR